MDKQFTMYYPVKPYHLNQGYGVANTSPSALPTYKALGLKAHNGLDLMAYHGQPVYASHDGIAFYEVDANQGDGFVIRTTEKYPYKGQQVYIKSVYWHLCPADPKHPKYDSRFKPVVPTITPTMVKAGDLIGYADNTGLSTGDHLHWAIKPIVQGSGVISDVTDDIGDFVNVEQNNGYLGAIDPTPYFNGLYAQDINNTKEPEKTISTVWSVLEQYGLTQYMPDFIKRFFGIKNN